MITGYVEIYRIEDGNKIKIYEDHNLVTKGFGYSLANMLTEQEDQPVENFQIGYFQVGISSVAYQSQSTSSAFYDLSNVVALSSYGQNLKSKLFTLYPLKGQKFSTLTEVSSSPIAETFVSIPNFRSTRVGDNCIKVRLFLEKNMVPNIDLREFGLYLKNPNVNYKIDKPLLGAYKKLDKKISKSQDFELFIEWTLKIVDLSEI